MGLLLLLPLWPYCGYYCGSRFEYCVVHASVDGHDMHQWMHYSTPSTSAYMYIHTLLHVLFILWWHLVGIWRYLEILGVLGAHYLDITGHNRRITAIEQHVCLSLSHAVTRTAETDNVRNRHQPPKGVRKKLSTSNTLHKKKEQKSQPRNSRGKRGKKGRKPHVSAHFPSGNPITYCTLPLTQSPSPT